ncbi:MAG: serine/threonine-protein kinase [Planctomycetota bacterium]|nr:serine/threonine-protein kinase [Planctomycetota bacterium]MDA1212662.1 serine/threonine-protein kinase [Planctomycetota bacterium]
MEPPSKHLAALLSELGLCTAHDLRRCRGRVRRLARDLPAFDSVWIDALVQARRLTPFQAQMLETDRSEMLKVGPCIIVDRLGTGITSETYLAEITARHERCVLKRIHVVSEQLDAATAGLQELVQRLSTISHPSIAGPFTVQRQQNDLFALSPYIAGPHLGELLIRRGRFDPHVVAAMARQLLDGLCLLEKGGGVHGDILLSNVRCMNTGRIVLVDTGITPVIKPHISYYDDSPPERYDGMAPELIGPGRRPDARSDIYALGCLLWQLLTARPPYVQADPLLKLAAHQTNTIDDVRTWAPDTPDLLADAILRFTSRDPSHRPRTFREARELFGPPSRRDSSRLRSFRSMFQSRAVPLRNRELGRPGRIAWTSAALLLVSGVVTTMFHAGLRTELLSLTQHVTQSSPNLVEPIEPDPAVDNVRATTPARWRPLPLPDATGTITLDSPGPYAAQEISQVGRLTIAAADDRPAVIIIEDQPLRVACEQFHLENVELKFGETTQKPANALLLLQAQEFSAAGCRFLTDDEDTSSAGNPRPAIGWRLVDANPLQGGTFALSQSIFRGAGVCLFLSDIPRKMTVENVLKIGSGPLVKLKQMPDTRRPLFVQLSSVTCRRSGPIFKVNLNDNSPSRESSSRPGQIQCSAENCVFDFAVAGEEQQASFIEFSDDELPADWYDHFELTGQGNLVNRDVSLAALVSPNDNRRQELDGSKMSVEGLMADAIHFLGRDETVVENSRIKPPQIPSLSSLPPGIDIERMPKWLRVSGTEFATGASPE